MNIFDEYQEPIVIAPGLFWVGHRSELDLKLNVYLRVFEGNGKKVNMLIDPGPSAYFNEITTKIEKILGPGQPIHAAYINHQGPDSCSNAILFQRRYPDMQVITTNDTWRLIRFYGLKDDHFIPIDSYKSGRVKMITGQKLCFIHTPYAHFRGACALYDVENGILFSGDLFGGLTTTPDLYADESYWDGVKVFHQIYMPANTALQKAVADFRKKAPDMKMIAPHHGKIIRQDLLTSLMVRLENLQVGLDLTTSRLMRENYINSINAVLVEISEKIDPEIAAATLREYEPDGSLPGVFDIKDGKITGIKVDIAEALQSFANQLLEAMASLQIIPDYSEGKPDDVAEEEPQPVKSGKLGKLLNEILDS